MDANEPKFKQEIQQMMYIAGETLEPSTEAVVVVEGIIRDQVYHMLSVASDLAQRRGSRYFSNNDIIFQFRHDSARIARLRNFLAWKSIRKGIKDDDDKADPMIDGAPDDLIDDPLVRNDKLPSVTLPWDVSSFFSVEVPPAPGQNDGINEDANDAYLRRLNHADERTRDMTAAEYATWSEYRHASFTWRKVKRFREWAGLGVIAEHKPADDVLDILGFLTSEMVQNLTMAALEVQKQEVSAAEDQRTQDVSTQPIAARGLFMDTPAGRKPIEPKHIRQAFQQLQLAPKKKRAMVNRTRLASSSSLQLL